jgi:thioredoxin reductase
MPPFCHSAKIFAHLLHGGHDSWRAAKTVNGRVDMAEQAEIMRDVVVVGGGAAGLSAALMLARSRRRVTVVDAGAPRNAPAEGVHGLLALDGVGPLELLARGRDEVTGYGGEILSAEVSDVSCTSLGFAVVMRDGGVVHARRLLIATGLVDELPEISGLRERWGRDVLHCPYCHGWEVRDRRIGVLATGVMSVHQALLFRQLSDDVRFFCNDHDLGDQDRAKLDALGIPVIAGGVSRLEIDGDRLTGVRLNDDRIVKVEALAVASRMVARAEVFAGIGIKATAHPVGSFIAADPAGRTSVPGVWVAGNSTDMSAQVGAAAADGARAAAHINADLVAEDTDRAVARLSNAEAVR